LVLHFQILHFLVLYFRVLTFGPAFLGPAFSGPAFPAPPTPPLAVMVKQIRSKSQDKMLAFVSVSSFVSAWISVSAAHRDLPSRRPGTVLPPPIALDMFKVSQEKMDGGLGFGPKSSISVSP